MAQQWAPLNSIITNNPDGTMTVTPPAGWRYAGYDSGGNFFEAAAAAVTVSCTCNGTGSCSPFSGSGPSGTTQGCAGNCSNCNMKVSGAGEINISSGGYFNSSIQGAIMVQGSTPLPAPFDAFLDENNTAVQQAIEQFINSVYPPSGPYPTVTISGGVATLPAGYSFALVNICGRGLTMPIPNPSLPLEALAGASASCSCTQGSCVLVTHSIIFIGSVSSCEGNCTGTCTLTCSVASGGSAYTTGCFQF